MVSAVTDPLILQQLEGGSSPAPAAATNASSAPSGPVTDPLVLKSLEGDNSSAPQMQGIMREPALAASSAAKGFLGFLGGLGNMAPGAGDPYATPGGVSLTQSDPGAYPNASDVLLSAARQAGVVDRPDLTPQGTGEKVLAAGGEGLGASLPLLPFTGPLGLVQGAGGGAGGELAAELAPNHPFLARLFGGLLGGGLAGGATNLAQRGINAARGVTTPLTQAYDRLGIPTALAGDVTGSPTLQRLQAFASQAPMGGAVGRASQDAIDSFGNAVENTAATLGKSRTAQDAGTVLQNEARNWRDTIFPQKQAEAWAPVNAGIPPLAAVRPDNYRTALGALSSKMAGLPETKKVLLSARSQQLLDAINTDVPPGAGMTWPEAQNLRSVIGEIRGVPEIADSIGDKELGRLYGALSEDMRTTADRYGVSDAFDAANEASTKGYAFQRNVLSKIIKSNNPLQETVNPEQAADNILNSGDTTLQAVRQELPAGANELAAYKLRDMALARAGKQGSAGETISPTTFLTDYNNLRMRAPAGDGALFRSSPQTAQAMDDLATVANRMKETTEHVNVSKTGPYLTTKAMAEAPKDAALGAMSGYVAGGPLGALAGGVGGLSAPFIPGLLGSALTTTPLLTRFMATPATTLPRGLAYGSRLLGGVAPEQLPPPR